MTAFVSKKGIVSFIIPNQYVVGDAIASSSEQILAPEDILNHLKQKLDSIVVTESYTVTNLKLEYFPKIINITDNAAFLEYCLLMPYHRGFSLSTSSLLKTAGQNDLLFKKNPIIYLLSIHRRQTYTKLHFNTIELFSSISILHNNLSLNIVFVIEYACLWLICNIFLKINTVLKLSGNSNSAPLSVFYSLNFAAHCEQSPVQQPQLCL